MHLSLVRVNKAISRNMWLKTFNYGPKFIAGIKLLLSNRKSAVNVGGHLTKNFALERGVPQGDPISAYLFVLAIEILNIAILSNTKIGKVHLTGETYITTEIYADDLSVVVPNSIESIEAAIETIKRFEKSDRL